MVGDPERIDPICDGIHVVGPGERFDHGPGRKRGIHDPHAHLRQFTAPFGFYSMLRHGGRPLRATIRRTYPFAQKESLRPAPIDLPSSHIVRLLTNRQ